MVSTEGQAVELLLKLLVGGMVLGELFNARPRCRSLRQVVDLVGKTTRNTAAVELKRLGTMEKSCRKVMETTPALERETRKTKFEKERKQYRETASMFFLLSVACLRLISSQSAGMSSYLYSSSKLLSSWLYCSAHRCQAAHQLLRVHQGFGSVRQERFRLLKLTLARNLHLLELELKAQHLLNLAAQRTLQSLNSLAYSCASLQGLPGIILGLVQPLQGVLHLLHGARIQCHRPVANRQAGQAT